MANNHLVATTDRAKLIKEAREQGLSDYKIIVRIIRGETYISRKAIAKKWAPLLGITPREFMRLARGGG
jgi:hypothetical protein